jgi:hypothetical protein
MPVEMPIEILVNAVGTLMARNKRRAEERRALQKQLSGRPPASGRHRAWMERRIRELDQEETACHREIMARLAHINERQSR